MSLSHSQYLAIEREYSRRLNQDREEQQQRIREVFGRLPELKAIEEELADLAYQKAEAMLAGQKDTTARLEARRKFLRNNKISLLKDSGYPQDYLELHYQCELCKDTGFTEEGECRCRQRAVTALLYGQSMIQEVLQRENFSTFRLDYYDRTHPDPESGITGYDLMRGHLEVCREFIEGFEQNRENLLLMGDTGTGKTFLSHCIAKELLDRYYSVIYLSATQLFEMLAKRTFGREGADLSEEADQIFTCDFLIIDDLGTELTNSFVTSQLFTCINERILRRRSTLISTNLTMNDMLRIYTERITSRLIGNYRILRFPERDIRLYKRMHGPE